MSLIRQVWLAVFGEDVATKPLSCPGRTTEHRVLCPFHHDRHRSCDVHLGKGTFICRACGASGGFLDVVIASGNASSKREAAQWLERRGITWR